MVRVHEFSLLIVGAYIVIAGVVGWFANDAAHKGVHVDVPAVLGS